MSVSVRVRSRVPMRLYSTHNPQLQVSFKEAVLNSLPPDGGLYMPRFLPSLPATAWRGRGIPQIAEEICIRLFADEIPADIITQIVYSAFDFDAPIHLLDDKTAILELFHGPTLAFKDFGARFMARIMSYFNQGEYQPLHILVATSGDTGGAVAAGFFDVPGIEVTILYPSSKVSALQEKQLTTLGKNIHALEVQGTFDDCQRLVKQAFLDKEINRKLRLSSANSISIARLIPQSFYYFHAYNLLAPDREIPLVFVVPSGNFGNLTGGILAARMGLPVHRFIAATNANDIVPAYLEGGEYLPRPSEQTISNAMDVGNPSNFARMLDLYQGNWEAMRTDISGYAFGDRETRSAMREVYENYRYVMDPHTAVGYLALQAYRREYAPMHGVVLATAHPAKFLDVVEPITGKIEIPLKLAERADLPKHARLMPNDFEAFKTYLLS